MTKRLLASFLIFLLLLTIASTVFAAGKTYRAERFDADWYVQEDGSLIISETVAFVFTGGPFTFVFRELPGDYSDSIEVLAVAMDGDQMTPDSGPGQYELEGGGDKKVTWHFAPSSNESHTFELKYQVHGAVRRENGQDVLVWNFLPTDYEYPIASANLKVGYPYEAKPVGPAEVRRGQAAVSEGPGLAVFTAKDIREGSPLTVALRFPAGSLIAEPPEWQQHVAQVAQNAPTMWLLAALLLSVGTVFLARAWSVGRRQDRSLAESRTMVRTTPPSDLSPALAGALVSTNARATLVQAIATLFGLAQRGVVTFEQTGEKKWYRDAQFAVRLQPRGLESANLAPDEQALVAGLFTSKGRDEISLAKLGEQLRKAMKPFGSAVDFQLAGQGMIDPARSAHAKRLMVTGVVLLVLALTALALVALLWRAYGGWTLLIPVAVFILSMVAFVLSAAYSPRSDKGEQAAADWRGFREYIKGVTKGREPAWDLHLFDRYFPYAAAFDLAQGWAKAFRDRGGSEVPSWFASLSSSGSDGMSAFIVMTSAVHSSTSSDGGAGSGGAGGGGGSGAG